MAKWNVLKCTRDELRLAITLVNGQSFRWNENTPGEWTSVLAGRVWTLSQNDEGILYRVHDPESAKKSAEATDFANILQNYFQLDISLSALYKQWNAVDANFCQKASNFQGARVLRQDCVENLFSFICSSNNNISRISQMVEKMCDTFGTEVAEVEGKMYKNFPTIEALTEDSVEQKLRTLGFGYRAKFIAGTAKYIKTNHGGSDWLYGLRNKPYDEVKLELMKLPGVGAKVADCVCLMSMDKTAATPVDTHVWQIANRDYKHLNIPTGKSMTDKIYNEISSAFRNIWGEYAGWAQCVLFSADLKKFQSPQKESSKIKKKSHKLSKNDDGIEQEPTRKHKKKC